MNKKYLSILIAIFALAIFGGIIENSHADTVPTLSPFYYNQTSTITTRTTSTIVQIPQLGTSTAPCVYVSNTSGTLATKSCSSGGGGSSTIITAGNSYLLVQQIGSNATLTPISVLSLTSSSDIGVSNATGTGITFSFLNPKNFATTTIQSVLNSLSATGLATYNSSTGVFNVSSSSLNLSQYLTTASATATYYPLTNPSGYVTSSITSYSRAVTKTVCASNAIDTTNCDYKATGTNDNLPLQTALNAVSSTCGLVQLSEGTFSIASSVTVPNCVILQGLGYGSQLLAGNGLDAPIITFNNSTLNIHDGVVNLQVDGNRTNESSTMDCIDARAETQSYFTGDWITQCANTAIAFTGTGGGTYGYNNFINNDLIDGNGQNGLTFNQNDENFIGPGIYIKTLTGKYIDDESDLEQINGVTCEGVSATSGVCIYTTNGNTQDTISNVITDGIPNQALYINGGENQISNIMNYNCASQGTTDCVLFKGSGGSLPNTFSNSQFTGGAPSAVSNHQIDEQNNPITYISGMFFASTSNEYAPIPSTGDADFWNYGTSTPGGGAYWAQLDASGNISFNAPTGNGFNWYVNNVPLASSSLFYGTSTGALTPLKIGTNLSISGNTLNAAGGGSTATTTPYINGNIVVASGTALSTFGGSTTSGGSNCLTAVTLSASGTLSNTNATCSGGGGGAATTTPYIAGQNVIASSSGSLSTIPWQTFWQPLEAGAVNQANSNLYKANVVILFGPVYITQPVKANAIGWYTRNADASSTDKYDIGLYSWASNTSTVATLVIDSGAQSQTSGGSDEAASSTQGLVTIAPGAYLIGITGSSSSVKTYGAGSHYWMLQNANGDGSVTSGGLLSATTSVPSSLSTPQDSPLPNIDIFQR